MAEYQRILSYLYHYDKKQKKDCKGFIKAEQKRSGLKLTIQIEDDRMMEDMALELCFYQKNKERWEMHHLDRLKTKRHQEETILFYPAERLPQNFEIQKQYGVLLYYQDSFYYGSVWIGEEIPINELILLYKKEQNDAQNIKEDAESEKDLDSPKYPENQMEDKEAGFADRPVDERKMDSDNKGWEDAGEDKKPEQKECDKRKETAEETENAEPEEIEKIKTEIFEIEEAKIENTDIENVGIENADFKNAGIENADIEEAETENAGIENADIEEAKTENAHIKNADIENKKDGSLRPENIRAAGAEERLESANIFNPAFRSGYKITVSQLELFSPEAQRLSENQFLVKGYGRYHHLLAGKVMYAGEERNCVGVPGIYENREKYMAEIYQFPVFLPLTENRIKTGGFGYWLHLLQE